MQGEKKALIEQCLDRGMSEDEIYEVLADYDNQKFLEEVGRNTAGRAAPCIGQAAPLRELNGQILEDDDGVSLAGKRIRAKEASPASVATYSEAKARAAYVTSQKTAQAARDRNRMGSGVF
jgi:hypothetical protein